VEECWDSRSLFRFLYPWDRIRVFPGQIDIGLPNSTLTVSTGRPQALETHVDEIAAAIREFLGRAVQALIRGKVDRVVVRSELRAPPSERTAQSVAQ
jgi:hypothetical protein